tara:strand:+ start:99 stop:251 length:153 start_codon:yes stop_codon:yes gene_type:complete
LKKAQDQKCHIVKDQLIKKKEEDGVDSSAGSNASEDVTSLIINNFVWFEN